MQRHTVQSAALRSIGYDPASCVLELEFHDDGGIWQYLDFTPAALKQFLSSESLGNYFVTKIKGKYKERKVA